MKESWTRPNPKPFSSKVQFILIQSLFFSFSNCWRNKQTKSDKLECTRETTKSKHTKDNRRTGRNICRPYQLLCPRAQIRKDNELENKQLQRSKKWKRRQKLDKIRFFWIFRIICMLRCILELASPLETIRILCSFCILCLSSMYIIQRYRSHATVFSSSSNRPKSTFRMGRKSSPFLPSTLFSFTQASSTRYRLMRNSVLDK